MKKTVLREYAKLIAKTGVNVQKGQEVFIQAELDQPEFVAMVVDECYKLKAKKVVVDWSYQPLTKLHVRYRSLKTLSTLDNYEEARWQHYVDTIPCRIYLISEDPDGLRGVNQEKMAKSQQAKYPIIKGYRDQIENKYQWCIAAVPGEKWAKKLFPELRASQAVEKLWEAIPSRMSLPQLSIGTDIKQRSFAVAAHGLERLRELVRAGRRLHAATDALEPVDDFVHIHALAELRNALRVAAAAVDELHVVHLSVFHLEEDLAGAGAPRRIFVCHVLISLSKN